MGKEGQGGAHRHHPKILETPALKNSFRVIYKIVLKLMLVTKLNIDKAVNLV